MERFVSDNMRKEAFIQNYSKAVHEGYAAIFAGAGTSVSAGFVDWKNLVRPFAEQINLDIEKEADLVKVTQYYSNYKRNRSTVNQEILNAFSSKEDVTEPIRILTRLPISTYWTTNYDRLIEEGLKENNRKADVKIDEENLANNIFDRDAVVYKMHGDVFSPHKAVITKDDYELYNEKHSLFTTALKGDLISKTFLFIGFSFEDPNLDDILAKVRVLLGENTREHYCFMEKINEKYYITDDGKSREADFLNDKIRQELRIEDLKRYGIETVVLDSYSEIPSILHQIERLHLNKSIFISGSISSYNEVWTESKVNSFCYHLSKELVLKDYRVISGFGLGIGSSIINGALDEIYKTKFKHVSEHLSLYPFPQVSDGTRTLKEMWTHYRKSIISESGICIFLFGNKLKDGKVVIADGMKEEFRIATELNKLVIPIFSTGEAAKEIFEVMKEDKNKYQYLEGFWEKLKNVDQEELIRTVLNIIDKNQK
ncbi:SIR2 family protein [Enterococcus gallinarum]|uniref:SIR2 family protein n=1 Tax=Enterococcus gallinarum TaxID=1353 RepID=UPI002433E64A|nr:SIR2 family protein [Enterococcus gallinarum]